MVREKARFPETRRLDGSVERPRFTRYFISLDERPDEEALVDEQHILRERRSFTKQLIRSFVKDNVAREAWNGAPWLVKDAVAQKLKIDTTVPAHLQHSNKIAERKAQLAQKKNGQDRTMLQFVLNPRLPELKPAPSWYPKHARPPHFAAYQQALIANRDLGRLANGRSDSAPSPAPPRAVPGPERSRGPEEGKKQQPPPPPPPPVKYPVDDLEVPPTRDGTRRPTLKYLSRTIPARTSHDASPCDIAMSSVGPMLETWNTLNVFCQVLLLDSFTFDDYVECLQLAADGVGCELFVEIHCALLKLLVEDDSEGGHILVQLPDPPEEDDEDDEDDEDEEEDGGGGGGGEAGEGSEEVEDEDEDEDEEEEEEKKKKEVENQSKRRSSSTAGPAKGEGSDAADLAVRSRSSSRNHVNGKANPRETAAKGPAAKRHRAAEMMADRDWIDRLRSRDFKNGGWEAIIVGLLDRLSLRPQIHSKCEEVLEQLAPIDLEPTQETARQQYATLDINLRATVLEMLCLLIVDLKSIRGYIENNNELMTEVRKEKVEWQRARKAAYVFHHFWSCPGGLWPSDFRPGFGRMEELRVLDEQRKLLLPQVSTPPPESDRERGGESTLNAQMGTEDEGDDREPTSATDGESSRGPGRRGRPSPNATKKRKRGEKQGEQSKQGPPGKISKVKAHFNMVLQKIERCKAKIRECEEEVAKADEDLREIECPRTKCLGKDRFWNRYWFLERNAMPWGGLPESSTADAEYANGCLWVQGPDELERRGFIDVDDEEAQRYRGMFQMTPSERKALEEGPTSLLTAKQWGYYDEPDSLDMLIGWLDTRGHRELKLRKELQTFRGKIVAHMDKRKAYIDDAARKTPEEFTTTRKSTRAKGQGDPVVHRCRRWRNTMAMGEIGHLHSDHPRPRKKGPDKKRGGNKQQGKPLTRQGTRYKF